MIWILGFSYSEYDVLSSNNGIENESIIALEISFI